MISHSKRTTYKHSQTHMIWFVSFLWLEDEQNWLLRRKERKKEGIRERERWSDVNPSFGWSISSYFKYFASDLAPPYHWKSRLDHIDAHLRARKKKVWWTQYSLPPLPSTPNSFTFHLRLYLLEPTRLLDHSHHHHRSTERCRVWWWVYTVLTKVNYWRPSVISTVKHAIWFIDHPGIVVRVDPSGRVPPGTLFVSWSMSGWVCSRLMSPRHCSCELVSRLQQSLYCFKWSCLMVA